MSSTLAGKNILIAEDEPLLNFLLEDFFTDKGARVLGPAENLESALALANAATIDAAILDINLGGAQSYPVAQVLKNRNVPYLFVTGYGNDPSVQGAPVLSKPYTMAELERAVDELLAPA